MNGAKSLVETFLNLGVDTCFANPGTSEMHFVAALDESPGMRCVLGLQENVVTGMADGYYRIAGKPACTLLHCGPGFSNGMANVHNARRAHSAMINVVGDQATFHQPFDAALTTDVEAMARTVSHWVHTSRHANQLGNDAARAVHAARSYNGQIATLVVPSDASWNEDGKVVTSAESAVAIAAVDPLAVENTLRVLRSGRRTLILLSGPAALAEGQQLAWRIASAFDAKVMFDYTAPRVARGTGTLAIEKVPYALPIAMEALKEFDNIILVNAKAPVGFFAYPGMPSIEYRSDAQLVTLSRPDQNPLEAMEAVIASGKLPQVAMPALPNRPEVASGAPAPEKVAQTVAALMPEHTIISDESISYGRGFYRASHGAPSHEWLHLVGGAIGDGMPVATGAAIAAGKNRRVINLQADGSALYSLQSLWTQARESLPVTTIILNNRKYNILLNEYKNVGAVPGKTAHDMLELERPAIDWVKLANSFGVEAARAETMEQLASLLKASLQRQEPFVIELMV